MENQIMNINTAFVAIMEEGLKSALVSFSETLESKMSPQLNAINDNVAEIADQIGDQEERLSSLEARFAPSPERLMLSKTYVENILRRNILPREVLSFEMEQDGAKVLVNTTLQGLGLRLRTIAKRERASVNEVCSYNHTTYYAESWLAKHVKPLG